MRNYRLVAVLTLATLMSFVFCLAINISGYKMNPPERVIITLLCICTLSLITDKNNQ